MSAASRPTPLATCTLDVEACCATARPADGGATFAVGTYTLVDQQHRTGVLYFFNAAAAVCDTGLQVLLLQHRLLHGVLTLAHPAAGRASAHLRHL
jgi:hypothetical protein